MLRPGGGGGGGGDRGSGRRTREMAARNVVADLKLIVNSCQFPCGGQRRIIAPTL